MRSGADLTLYRLHNSVEVIGPQPLSSQINHETLQSKFNKIVEMLQETEWMLRANLRQTSLPSIPEVFPSWPPDFEVLTELYF